MKCSNAYSNPEYMSLDEIIQLINEYKRTNNIQLTEPVNKFNTLPVKKPPNKRPPSPPKTPPPIFYRTHREPVRIYQNVPISTSQIYSETSSNATMIIRDTITPPRPIMTSSRLNLNPFQKNYNLNTIVNLDIPEDFSILEEDEETAITKIIESTRIKSKSPNGKCVTKQTIQEESYCCCMNNPNYYMLQKQIEQFSSNMELNDDLDSPNTSLINKAEIYNSISPPSPFKEGNIKRNYSPRLSPSKNLLMTDECTKEILIEKIFTCSNNCYSYSSESCSSTSTSGYKSNQSNLSNSSINNSSTMTQQAELNYFIEMNMKRLNRLKTKRMQLLSNSSSCQSIKSIENS